MPKTNRSTPYTGSPYVCDRCEKSFTKKQGLQRHILIHTGEKPFRCEYPGCSDAFIQSSALREHMSKHSDIKRFECRTSGCAKRYKHQRSRDRHEQETHTNPSVRYSCHVKDCGRSFQRQDQFKDHFRTHGLDPNQPEEYLEAAIDINPNTFGDESQNDSAYTSSTFMMSSDHSNMVTNETVPPSQLNPSVRTFADESIYRDNLEIGTSAPPDVGPSVSNYAAASTDNNLDCVPHQPSYTSLAAHETLMSPPDDPAGRRLGGYARKRQHSSTLRITVPKARAALSSGEWSYPAVIPTSNPTPTGMPHYLTVPQEINAPFLSSAPYSHAPLHDDISLRRDSLRSPAPSVRSRQIPITANYLPVTVTPIFPPTPSHIDFSYCQDVSPSPSPSTRAFPASTSDNAQHVTYTPNMFTPARSPSQTRQWHFDTVVETDPHRRASPLHTSVILPSPLDSPALCGHFSASSVPGTSSMPSSPIGTYDPTVRGRPNHIFRSAMNTSFTAPSPTAAKSPRHFPEFPMSSARSIPDSPGVSTFPQPVTGNVDFSAAGSRAPSAFAIGTSDYCARLAIPQYATLSPDVYQPSSMARRHSRTPSLTRSLASRQASHSPSYSPPSRPSTPVSLSKQLVAYDINVASDEGCIDPHLLAVQGCNGIQNHCST